MSETADTSSPANAIAVVGLAGRFPGARDIAAYWENLRAGVESIQHFSIEELEAAGVPPDLLRRPNYVRASAILDEVEHFDASFFGVGPKDAAIMDPQHRIFLECAWEALEHAGHVPRRFPGAVGVFAGCGMNSYFIFNLLSNPALVENVGLFLLRHTSNDKDFLATFASYKLNLRGPSVSIQTACSTSLVAIHTACQSLLTGECDMALAGGSTVHLPHKTGYLYHPSEILAPDGHCRAFDAAAEGTVFGSGAGVVVLRRLQDALEDRDTIHAVIVGSAINNDGSLKAGYLAPSVEGQAGAIAEALSVSGIDADSVSYVEAHGTGTAIGDPIEVAALTRAFRETSQRSGFCALGSVKPNIGHLDTAAGVASFIKTVLALEHRELPPSLHFEEPNPNIDFASSPFFVNATLSEWKTDALPRRAGISSLGVGGTNAHVILEEAPAPPQPAPSRPDQLLLLSARTRSALDEASRRLASHLRAHPEADLSDVAYTLQLGRESFAERRATVARSAEEAAALLEESPSKRVFSATASSQSKRVALLFPGGGAQYPGMGAGLYESEPVFREHIDRGLALLRDRWDLQIDRLLFARDADLAAMQSEFERPSLQLPAIFLVEYALAQLWTSWGVRFDALAGHSMGENTAACLAGVFSFEDALGLVALRGRLFERVARGGMTSVALPPEELEPLLGEELSLAVVNGPSMCVASGSLDALARLETELDRKGVEHHRVKIAVAAHSPMLDPILAEFEAYLRGLTLRAPRIPFVSNRSGTWITAEDATNPAYWVEHLRHTVDFAACLEALLEAPDRVLLEVGPGKTLSSLARQQSGWKPGGAALASLRHPDEVVPDLEFTLGMLGRLWLAGVDVDWNAYHAGERRRRVPLPTYPFERQRYWIEPGRRVAEASDAEKPLQRLEQSDDWFHRPAWVRRALGSEAEPPAGGAERQRWLVFLDSAGLGREVARRLASRGHDVVSVSVGDTFHRLDDRHYLLPPESGRAGYDELLHDLAARELLPDHVAHLWMVTEDESFRPGSSFLHRTQEQGFYSLLFLAQALGELGESPLRTLSVISNGMQSVAGEALPHPEKATLLGPVKVIPREFEGVRCRSVDVELAPPGRRRSARRRSLEARADELLAELGAPPEEAVVALRGGERWVQCIERGAPEAPGAERVPLRERGVYLITGGLGGIGLAVAEHLARRVKARLVLVGRGALPPREQWQHWLGTHSERDATSRRIRAVGSLEALGAEVEVAAVDIANIERMADLLAEIEQRFGTLHGVIHAAGVTEDGVIQLKTPEAVDRVFTPKVHGTLVLERLLADRPLDFLALFSSTSTVLGPPGQVDYVAANCFLDALAESRRMRGKGRTVSIAWGVWNEVGMADTLSRRLRGEDDDETGLHRLISHPLLDECIADEADRWVYAGTWRPEERWVLDEHRIRSGTAVLPGAAYVELAHAAWRDATGEQTFEIQGLTLLSPLELGDGEAREVQVELLRQSDGSTLEVRSRPRPAHGAEFEVHARARLSGVGTPQPPAVDLDSTSHACARSVEDGGGRPLPAAQAAHVSFGPRWASLRRIGRGAGEAFVRVELPEEFTRDLDAFDLHPALLDVASGCALPLIEGYDAALALYVPVAYERVCVRGPIPRRVFSHVRSRPGNSIHSELATFDVLLLDESGDVRLEIEGFAMRRVGDPARFAAVSTGHQQGEGVHLGSADVRPPLSAAEKLFLESLDAGIRVEEGMAALERILEGGEAPRTLVSSIDLGTLVARSDAASVPRAEEGAVRFARPELASAYEEPRDEIEQTLVEYWQDLLGVDRVGIQDDFFELGGHSLIAVRLFARVKKAFGVESPLSVLFEAPTVAGYADLLRAELGDRAAAAGAATRPSEPRFRYLVPMNAVSETRKRPFFIVAGMFGNVLNLRHLAAHLGHDQPVYALQARGLTGDDEPHRRFEEMARDYLVEIRSLQPEGPYLLGGFSGGGITALEMAQQLLAQGETVGLLAMLDTPAGPEQLPTRRERLLIQSQRLRREGMAYVGRWASRRLRWELERLRGRLQPPAVEQSPAEFRSSRIEAAFREAVEHYRIPVYAGKLVLFRPPLDAAHALSEGRVASSERVIVDSLNHWKPFVTGGIDLHVVPGDHDSMVLEPNVRVLAQKLRSCLEDAQPAKCPEADPC